MPTSLPSMTSDTTPGPSPEKWKVAIIGSGNWGSAIARLIGINTEQNPDLFDQEVRMWCYEEEVNGRLLTEQFNELHENVKYLPGVKMSPNIIAVPDVVEAIKGANALVFVLPHQFIRGICTKLEGSGHLLPGARAISLVKGVDVQGDHIHILADVIERHLGIPCSALSGANIAKEVANDEFSETTIGCRNLEDGERWKLLFQTRMFRVQLTDDVNGVSLCGALKNVVAIGAGLSDGLGWGANAKAAIMRIGLIEMRKFSMTYFTGCRADTFLQESAGVADLITSCLGGRNRRCAEAFVTSGKSFDQLEKEMLNGQKLQGVVTAKELHDFLLVRGDVNDYPLFTAVYRIAYEGLKPNHIVRHI